AAILGGLLRAGVSGRMALRLPCLLLGNTLVAILIGLAVANVVQPGRWLHLPPPANPGPTAGRDAARPAGPLEDLLGRIPGSVVTPFANNDILSVIVIALAFGVALRVVRDRQGGRRVGVVRRGV